MDGPDRPRTSRRSARATFTVEAVQEREQVTDHDVAAFVDVLSASGGRRRALDPLRADVSSDVLDTALALQLRAAGEIVLAGARELARRARRARARARRHGLRRAHARRARRADDVRHQARGLRLRGATATPQRLERAFDQASVGAISGAVGTYSATLAGVRGARAGAAGPAAPSRSRRRSSRATATPSCCRRSRWPARGWSASRPRSATCSAPRCARSRSRSASGSRRARARCRTSATRSRPSGSPAWRACCAATRTAGVENVALWHERDISHSGAERVVLPDATILLDYMQSLALRVVARHGRPRRPHAREPRPHPRRAVLPARAARARGAAA